MVITETPPHAETKTTYNHQPLFSWDTSPETMVCVHARLVRGQFLKGHCLSNCAKCHICDVDLSMAKNVLCIDPTCPKQGKELIVFVGIINVSVNILVILELGF